MQGHIFNSITFILAVAVGMSFVANDVSSAGVIIAVILLNIAIGFYQEYQSESTMDTLRRMSSPTARVVRGGKLLLLPAAEITLGDIVILEAGRGTNALALLPGVPVTTSADLVLNSLGVHLWLGHPGRDAHCGLEARGCSPPPCYPTVPPGPILGLPPMHIRRADPPCSDLQDGDQCPADVRLLEAVSLEMDEALLTGESLPVAKSIEPVQQEDTPLGDRHCMAFKSCIVTQGRGRAIVVKARVAPPVQVECGVLQAPP